jgi:homoserine dehydrogenase
MIEIAILGFGVVGSGVAEVIQMNQETIRQHSGQDIHIKRILDIREFPGDPLADRITRNAEEILDDPAISVVVETMGGVDVPYDLSARALERGKHVVTSNKELVAARGPELMALAQRQGVSYMFEASVGGGIPIVRPLHKCLSANVINQITGILNGTTNYILTRMDEGGIDFDLALAEAQANGYAEKDPTADIEGLDACRKIAILSSIIFSEYVDSRLIYTEGISGITTEDMAIARSLGCKIKLIARFRRGAGQTADLIVAPMLVPQKHPLAVADDVNNAILVEGNALGEAMFYGRGAGRLPTASAVVADVIECVMHIGKMPHLVPWKKAGRPIVADHASCPVQALLRLRADVPLAGVEAKLGAYRELSRLNSEENDIVVGENGGLSEGVLDTFLASTGFKVISRIRIF